MTDSSLKDRSLVRADGGDFLRTWQQQITCWSFISTRSSNWPKLPNPQQNEVLNQNFPKLRNMSAIRSIGDPSLLLTTPVDSPSLLLPCLCWGLRDGEALKWSIEWGPDSIKSPAFSLKPNIMLSDVLKFKFIGVFGSSSFSSLDPFFTSPNSTSEGRFGFEGVFTILLLLRMIKSLNHFDKSSFKKEMLKITAFQSIHHSKCTYSGRTSRTWHPTPDFRVRTG